MENTDSIPKKRKKKQPNEKGTQVELRMREDIHDLELAYWRLARATWSTERGNMREIKALYGEIFRLHELLEEVTSVSLNQTFKTVDGCFAQS